MLFNFITFIASANCTRQRVKTCIEHILSKFENYIRSQCMTRQPVIDVLFYDPGQM